MKLATARAVEMTVPPPRRLLDCFLNSNPERSFPRPSAQASFRLILRLEKTSASIKSEVAYIKALANIYTCYGFRGKRERLKIAVLLTANFDESGTGHNEQLCVVAGFVGNDAQWASFIADWIPALGHHRKNLHMTKLRWNQRYDAIAESLALLGPIPHR
jgi:hypothetical protein